MCNLGIRVEHFSETLRSSQGTMRVVHEHLLTEMDKGWLAAELHFAAFWVHGSGVSPTIPGLDTALSSG